MSPPKINSKQTLQVRATIDIWSQWQTLYHSIWASWVRYTICIYNMDKIGFCSHA